MPFPKRRVSRTIALRELELLEAAYPLAATALEYTSPFTLLIAVILSAQCTDARVNQTTPHLFAAYPTPETLGSAQQSNVEQVVKSCGFFRMKAKNIIAAAHAIATRYGGEVPREREALQALPGVGRKTANVVLSVAFEEAALAVDTHVFRVAHRLGLTLGKTPRDVEDDVSQLVPREKLRHAHHWLILHGRAICKAPVPLCERCPVNELCPTAPLVARAHETRLKKARLKKARLKKAGSGQARQGAPDAAIPRRRRSP
ncbi:MAG: endonuclease III [Candidatus Eremiobacteraeota bacterium]|nr:endonuclease III [Candidatus Eremiobacteraeota bacterium]MBC5802040.1 endonuclease III [Candidatus Eremiobacteraeota bacterium]MBC5822556.1 endonuclease III [Candidatus Eremiobacteraeota bacterium]